jgi:FHA domain
MARLQLLSEGFNGRILVLNLGVNSVGRHSHNHFQIEDPSVSGTHCEIILNGEELIARDCDSTNGTFVDGQPVREARLTVGQVLRFGTIECLVEDTNVSVSIPEIIVEIPAPPKVRDNGAICCPRHESVLAAFRCPRCRTVMCRDCVHRIRRRGGKELLVCPNCSSPLDRLLPEEPQKRSFLDLLKTIKLPFAGGRKPKQR